MLAMLMCQIRSALLCRAARRTSPRRSLRWVRLARRRQAALATSDLQEPRSYRQVFVLVQQTLRLLERS